MNLLSKADIKPGPSLHNPGDQLQQLCRPGIQSPNYTRFQQKHSSTRFSPVSSAKTISKIRKKAFSHKVRSGCHTCELPVEVAWCKLTHQASVDTSSVGKSVQYATSVGKEAFPVNTTHPEPGCLNQAPMNLLTPAQLMISMWITHTQQADSRLPWTSSGDRPRRGGRCSIGGSSLAPG